MDMIKKVLELYLERGWCEEHIARHFDVPVNTIRTIIYNNVEM